MRMESEGFPKSTHVKLFLLTATRSMPDRQGKERYGHGLRCAHERNLGQALSDWCVIITRQFIVGGGGGVASVCQKEKE